MEDKLVSIPHLPLDKPGKNKQTALLPPREREREESGGGARLAAMKPILKPYLFVYPFSILLVFLLLRSSFIYSSGKISLSAFPQFSPTPSLRIRSGFSSYDDYLRHQLNKTLDPRLRLLWSTRDWDRKVIVFSRFFSDLISSGLLSNSSRSLCIGARLGQEVAALRRIGVADSIGLDLAPAPPLVVAGDFHAQPFAARSFDFEFSNVFDHALYPDRFVSEIERTLRPGGVCVLHVAVGRRGDRYSANDLAGVDGVVSLFRDSDAVRVRKIDGFGLNVEVVFRRRSGA